MNNMKTGKYSHTQAQKEETMHRFHGIYCASQMYLNSMHSDYLTVAITQSRNLQETIELFSVCWLSILSCALLYFDENWSFSAYQYNVNRILPQSLNIDSTWHYPGMDFDENQ